MSEYYMLYANCILVKGYSKAIIMDLQRNNYVNISNKMADSFNSDCNSFKIESQITQDNISLPSFVQDLINKNLIFKTEEPDLFPSIDKKYKEPYKFTNSIIDQNKQSSYNLKETLDQLSALQVKFIQIRFFDTTDITKTEEILKYIEKMRMSFLSVELLIKSTQDINTKKCIELIKKYNRISNIILHSASSNNFIPPIWGTTGYIISTDTHIKSSLSCGQVNQTYFTINIKSYTESLEFNSCLNRKICIDVNGNIKNCPSMKQAFGNIKNTLLKKAIEHPDFKKTWNISKDNIEICKDCEFRYMCTDCRAFIKNPKNIFSQPEKCKHNPYTAQWSHQKGYSPVENFGVYNSQGQFVINELKLKHIINNKNN